MSGLYDAIDFEPLDAQPDSELIAVREVLASAKRQGLTWQGARRRAERLVACRFSRRDGEFGEESVRTFTWRHFKDAYLNRPARRYCAEPDCPQLAMLGEDRCHRHRPHKFCGCGHPIHYASRMCRACRVQAGWSHNKEGLAVGHRSKMKDSTLEAARGMVDSGVSLWDAAYALLDGSGYSSVSNLWKGLDRAFRRRGWATEPEKAAAA